MNNDALLRFALAVKNTDYHFITITPSTHLIVNNREENRWSRTLRDVIGWSRPFGEDFIINNKELFDLMVKAEIVVKNDESWKCLIRISTLDGELFIHSSFPTISSDSVFFGPDTYRFVRAIKSIISLRKNSSLPVNRGVDIGCGAGPGAIILAKSYPNAQIFAGDINSKALHLTEINSNLSNVKVICRESNLLNEIEGQFDLIVSNPPYLVDSSKRRYRHGGGLLGSDLSLSIIECSCERLSPNGTLLLYTGSPIINGEDLFYQQAKLILENSILIWSYEEIDPDVFGEELENEVYLHADRIAAVLLIVTKNIST